MTCWTESQLAGAMRARAQQLLDLAEQRAQQAQQQAQQHAHQQAQSSVVAQLLHHRTAEPAAGQLAAQPAGEQQQGEATVVQPVPGREQPGEQSAVAGGQQIQEDGSAVPGSPAPDACQAPAAGSGLGVGDGKPEAEGTQPEAASVQTPATAAAAAPAPAPSRKRRRGHRRPPIAKAQLQSQVAAAAAAEGGAGGQQQQQQLEQAQQQGGGLGLAGWLLPGEVVWGRVPGYRDWPALVITREEALDRGASSEC